MAQSYTAALDAAKVRDVIDAAGAASIIPLEVTDSRGVRITLRFTLNEVQPPQELGFLIGRTDNKRTVNVFFRDTTVTINCG